MKKITIFITFILLSSLAVVFSAPKNQDLTLLYFFSPSCPHCAAVAPVIKELSKEYPVQGLVYGKGTPQPMPFDVERGNEETSARYGIQGVPALIAFQNDTVRQIFRGEYDIRDARTILRGFLKGALTPSEAAAKGQKSYTITGWIINKGEYFKDAHFYLTDRRQSIAVKPWLPLEAVKSLFRKTRPRLMSDVIDKPVILHGDLIKNDDAYLFVVHEEVTAEEK